MNTIETIDDAITAIKDGWTATALDILEEARLDMKAQTQLMKNGLVPESFRYLVEALRHCEDVLTRYEINRIDGEEISDNALSIIRAAIAKASGDPK